METMLGVINLDSEHDFLNELTYFRCGAATPFGGRYRLIDFVLSNMTNANIRDIAVFTRKKYRSLMDHLGTGSSWDLDRKHGGLFILPPDWNDPTDISKGDFQHFHNNRDFFSRSTSQYVLISGSQHICNINYNEALEAHLSSGADITVLYKSMDMLEDEHQHCFKLHMNPLGRVMEITKDHYNHNVFLGMFILKKSLLLELVDHCIARGMSNFFEDGIIQHLSSLIVYGVPYHGHLAVINSIESYYKHTMSLLNPDVYQSLFFQDQLIFTKVKDEPPAKYLTGSKVKNSLVANGCIIEGEVENCVLFRGVHIKKGASIKNSIIMQRCEIEENVRLDRVIIDKDVHLLADRTLIGAAKQPYVVAKRKVI
ncbi:glucose-1-phosphate adenylyltransferase subunit GlgD [Alkalihalobacillus sp. LMS39]|uniref:glucose-1-phosphate adenylyltransferase subunit GlgD n=1 Tax=Alkalihalobacillus sp. LMS39 TaxID=2924032 RepID=UPI001FB3BB89|nr:glucose-1-phosphate adenylyltransferase subunit GlgD [Alkalihalobacillus sp. LMS39]UOE95394.1 glucose-1-phosphate adenylyltransferase subunit GlgD [Alkalihalobacillus sp. LMS39]